MIVGALTAWDVAGIITGALGLLAIAAIWAFVWWGWQEHRYQKEARDAGQRDTLEHVSETYVDEWEALR